MSSSDPTGAEPPASEPTGDRPTDARPTDDRPTDGTASDPPWDDVRAEDPEVISRDGTIVVRRRYHNVAAPEWPPLIIEARVKNPSNPELTLRQILEDLVETRVFYELISPDRDPDRPIRPEQLERPGRPIRPDILPPTTDPDRRVPATEYLLILDGRAPQPLPVVHAVAQSRPVHAGPPKDWVPAPGAGSPIPVTVVATAGPGRPKMIIGVTFSNGRSVAKFSLQRGDVKQWASASRTTVWGIEPGSWYTISLTWRSA
ncbi:hypothetical protein FAIPA1_180048 [Frankia sp. AiPs1]|uniref:hypothetical protein n=1 Tax=Frankia sp. AiPa1 TaxID=573492 RepID=UPI00202B2646|nr:hypothetical protein [Frankia sp. AiPa1]MCL9759572.1 hypothetical protein [Frankia sp. AiPa1]